MLEAARQTPDIEPFAEIDRHFADWMVRLSSGTPADMLEDLWLAAALASNAVTKGHICVSLSDWAGRLVEGCDRSGTQAKRYPDLSQWVDKLKITPVVGVAGEFKPLILDEKHRLYLQRYWAYEGQLAGVLLAKARSPKRPVDEQLLRDGLQRLFPQDDGEEVNWQRVAALAATLNALAIISGGPGTGKTFTMAKILALMVEQAKDRNLAVALAAPTGKAAARLKGVIQEGKVNLNCSSDVKALIPEEASTIHRLLGPTRNAGFRFNKENPLPYDVVAIDEASMSDLPLMAKLVSALKGDARLILLGDKEQLASVEPGAVFSDICEAADANRFSSAFRRHVRRLTGDTLPGTGENLAALADSAVVLEKNYRFGSQSGIGILSGLVKGGEGKAALELLKNGGFSDISWQDVPPASELAGALERNSLDYHANYLKAKEPVSAFALFNRFHMLCALREGPYGVSSINQAIQDFCARRGLIRREGRWYRGQPLLVIANDYRLKLFNGDIGILLDDPETGSLRVFFPTEDGTFRKVLPGKLSAYETAHAITVHKSQGSEFEHILVLLPDRRSEVVTRELIYTAITRARKRVEVWGREEVFVEAISSRTRRVSGLKDRLRTE
ncbi:MAG: exodeoxyribonuclease V subunit alpha [Syntrophorhabdales bacterium]|jgi:exodeoxyribonuclease V alpha subunit